MDRKTEICSQIYAGEYFKYLDGRDRYYSVKEYFAHVLRLFVLGIMY